MARIDENMLINRASGNVAKQFVFKKRGMKTHIAKMPPLKSKAIPTAQQESVRDSFGSAVLYAKGAVSDPDLKNEYKEKTPVGSTAFNTAMKDYFNSPVVSGIDHSEYDGALGSSIVIFAKDDFRVIKVKVSIRNATGTLVEEGTALLDTRNHNKWDYKATQLNATLTGSKITATAFDLPGNKGTLEVTI